MPTTRNVVSAIDTGDHRQFLEELSVQVPDNGAFRGLGLIGVLSEAFDHADFTDGGGAAGTIQFAGSVPAGAVLLGSKVMVPEGFAGNTSAALIIGDGDGDPDRYMTGTPSVFTIAATGIQSGVPSGDKLVTIAERPTITVTAQSDWGSVTAGKLVVSIYYLQTA